MSNSKALAPIASKSTAATVATVGAAAANDVALIKEQYLPGGTDNQLRLLLAFGRNKGLDLVTRQYYGVIRNTKRGDTFVPVMTIQIGIDGYLAIAQRTGEFDSIDGPYWCGPDGVWVDVWLDDANPPVAAKTGIRRKDSQHTTWHVAKYREYVQMVDRWEGSRDNRKKVGSEPNEMWGKMPSNQLAKCSLAGALRKACPEAMQLLSEPDLDVSFSEGAPASINVEDDVRRPKAPIERPKARSAQQPVTVDEDGVIEGEYDDAEPAAPASEKPASETVIESFKAKALALGYSEEKVLSFAEWDAIEGHTRTELAAVLTNLEAAGKTGGQATEPRQEAFA